jgi:alkanesulfonate monooxygenase SsuD/methylene tetrahydromethanopterin reductase-like flavin-dependent oxidoreductase (luciferase family)
MRYALALGNGGPYADPRTMADLAVLAEDSGWDAVFLEDYICYQGTVGTPTYDPWVTLAAMATATRRIRLGTSVTPLPRRRPWKLAAEAITLDHLSGGRVILGLGAGDAREASFVTAGETTEQRVAGRMLDEGLELLAALVSGDTVSHHGPYYGVDGLRLQPASLQRPRIPLWIGGDWLVRGVRRRMPLCDGCCLYKGTPGVEPIQRLNADDVREMRSLIERERGSADGYEICVGGEPRAADRERERDRIRSLAAAGTTWWSEWVPPCEPEQARRAVTRGPLRV